VILAVHAIFGTYGFWLPNDPRGSWSTYVASWELYKYGPATTVSTNRSLAHRTHDRESRVRAKEALKHPPVLLGGVQARAVSRGFTKAVQDGKYIIHACSILPDHVHLVIARHSSDVREIITHLKSAATRQLRAENLHPFQTNHSSDEDLISPWARRGWTVFLNSSTDVQRAIKYVTENPSKEGKQKQSWRFVTRFAQ
jgi:REP element-mobilizing transposase RayT